jgi:hypothetical protein
VHLEMSKRSWRHCAAPRFEFIFGRAIFTALVFACVAFAGGCAGVVTPSSSSSGSFSISGSITPAADGNGASIALSGPSAVSATASSSGNYSFSGLVNGNYTVTPSRTGYVFTPEVQTVTINGSSATGVNFTGATQSNQSVLLNWQASTSTVSGYNVYRSTVSGGPYSRVNGSLVSGLTYTDSAVAASTTYYYVTTSVTSAGVESGYSNQASATIP